MSLYFLETTAYVKLFVQEVGTEALLGWMATIEDSRKLILMLTPLEIHAAIRRRQRAGQMSAEAAEMALKKLEEATARIVQQPVNSGVLEYARQVVDRTPLRWPEALQLGAARLARSMAADRQLIFISASAGLLEAAKAEGLKTMSPLEMAGAGQGQEEPAAG